MKLSALLTTTIAAAALAACAANTANTASNNAAPSAPPAPPVVNNTTMPTAAPALPSHLADEKFECRNGATAIVRHNAGEDKINLSVDTVGSTVTLTQARAASGNRYVNDNGFYGKTTEFHYKGNMGALTFSDPYGNVVETACDKK